MSNPKNRITLTVAILVAVVACIAGLYVAQQMHSNKSIDKSLFHGTLLDSPRTIHAFNLTGTDNRPYNNNSLLGHWTLMFFGFTNCGYMCPTTMGELGKTYRLLEKQNATTLPQVVMITLDPARDSLSRLKSYVQAFDRHFYGARGNAEMISAMTKDMGIAYAKVMHNDANGVKQQDIEHTGAVMLFNPHGSLVAFFTTPHRADDIASDYLYMIK